jgi:hypothetical protein
MAVVALVAPTLAAPILASSAASAAPSSAKFVAGPGQAAPPPAAPASAAPPSSPMAPAAVSPAVARQNAAIGTALRTARASEKPVPVAAETTETQTMTANPSGTVTVRSNVLPVRVRRGGAWTAIDPTLRRSADGGYTPAATWAPVSLSGGGTDALATLGTNASGLTLTWPSRLPAPSISGAIATYRDVLPGVDLLVTATDMGGLSEVLVVRDTSAAANPKLRALTLGLVTHGLTVSNDGNGNLTATNSTHQLAYSAPAATMWDSAGAAKVATATRPTAPDPAASSAAGPGPGAHVAKVRVSVSRGGLTLRPDQSLLHGAHTEFPVFIDPTWNPNYANGSEQAYDEVQEGCPTTSNYNSTTYSGEPAVGLNSFSGCIGRERSYFRVGIPSAVWGTHVVSATVNTIETYSSSCSASGTVHLWSTGGISSFTTWNTRPTPSTDVTSRSIGPACSSAPSVGFTVTSKAVEAAAGHWTSWTFVLIGNESSGTYRKRFEHNPSIQIEYNHIPDVPSSPAAAAGSTNVGCATATPYPWMGSTAGVTPPTMQAKLSDGDGGQVQGTFSYWEDGTTTKYTLTSTVASGGTAKVSFPSSFISGLTTGAVVDWQTQATDGLDMSAWSAVCHFGVDLTAPPPPTITSQDGKYPATGAGAPAGTTGTFTLSETSGTNAASFVFSLDTVPPTSNPPASETVSATDGTASASATPLAPGTHMLWAYALDQAGNESGLASYQFAVAGHTYPGPFASLSAAFNNTAISLDSTPTAADADGVGDSLSAQDLQAAGWQPGGKITIDGANFTLPNFGVGQADNALAANQTITMPAGTRGNALVFLAMSTAASAQVPDGLDVTSPAVPEGTSVTGTDCTYIDGDTTQCQPASGAISYGSAAPAQSYYLTVPDWINGPRAQSVIQLPHRNTPTGRTTSTPKIYAFAVPLNPSVALESVTLPDVSNSLAQMNMPGLHIFGMAVRDTTSAPSGASWTGAWAGPNEASFNYLGGVNYGNQTFRISAVPSVAGNTVRVKLSDALGYNPLTIDHVTIATQASGASPTATPVNLTFGGASGVTIPVGGDAYSDPVTFQASPTQALMVSMHLVNSVTLLVQHSWAANEFMWVSAVGSGDHTADTAATAFSGAGTHAGYFSDILTGIDVTATGNPGTVAVLGNNLTNPTATGMSAIGANRQQLSVDLAHSLRGNTQGVPNFGVIEAGIENNGILRDVFGNAGGVSALARLDRDVLSEPGISTVIVTEGLTDLLNGTSADDLEDAYATLAGQLNAWGITVVFLTLTPCDGYAPCTTAVDGQRSAANDWLGNQNSTIFTPYVYSADANAAVAIDDPASTSTPPEQKLNNGAAPNDADSGDHVNLTNDGYAAITEAIPLTDLTPNTPPEY